MHHTIRAYIYANETVRSQTDEAGTTNARGDDYLDVPPPTPPAPTTTKLTGTDLTTHSEHRFPAPSSKLCQI